MKKLTYKEFIIRANKVHNKRYSYLNAYYYGANHKLAITCYIHGDFYQTPANHLIGRGCKKCNVTERQRLRLEEVIDRFKKIHGDKYLYDKVKYTNSYDKVLIGCKKHGYFYQVARSHWHGHGCCHCAGLKWLTTKEFIERSKLSHDKEYDYSQSIYLNGNTKIIIICLKHGKFKQLAQNHMKGADCPKCKESRGEKKIRQYLEQYNILYKIQYAIQLGKGWKRFDFYLPEANMVIEYQGEQHFHPCNFGSKIKNADIQILNYTQSNDKMKRNYCKQNMISYQEIYYWQFNYIENVLDVIIPIEIRFKNLINNSYLHKSIPRMGLGTLARQQKVKV